MNKYFKECFVEQLYHFEALDCWDKLKVSTPCTLDVDKDEFKGQVLVKFIDEKSDQKMCIGVLSKDDSAFLADVIGQGWNEVFEAVISQKEESASENKKIKVVIRIQRKS